MAAKSKRPTQRKARRKAEQPPDVEELDVDDDVSKEDAEEFRPKQSALKMAGMHKRLKAMADEATKAADEVDHPGMADAFKELADKHLTKAMVHAKDSIVEHHGKGADADELMEKLCKAAGDGFETGETNLVQHGDVPPDAVADSEDDDVEKFYIARKAPVYRPGPDPKVSNGKCPECNGKAKWDTEEGIYYCDRCGHQWDVNEARAKKSMRARKDLTDEGNPAELKDDDEEQMALGDEETKTQPGMCPMCAEQGLENPLGLDGECGTCGYVEESLTDEGNSAELRGLDDEEQRDVDAEQRDVDTEEQRDVDSDTEEILERYQHPKHGWSIAKASAARVADVLTKGGRIVTLADGRKFLVAKGPLGVTGRYDPRTGEKSTQRFVIADADQGLVYGSAKDNDLVIQEVALGEYRVTGDPADILQFERDIRNAGMKIARKGLKRRKAADSDEEGKDLTDEGNPAELKDGDEDDKDLDDEGNPAELKADDEVPEKVAEEVRALKQNRTQLRRALRLLTVGSKN